MQPRINHNPTDRDKQRWKAIALTALIALWLISGIVGRDPWKPDEPLYIGILQSMLENGDLAWWSPLIAGQPVGDAITLIHWLNTPILLLAKTLLPFLPLHEAARISSILWSTLGIMALALAARRWSNGHISYLAAIIAIGCVGLYDRAHSYVPDIALFAAISIALYGCAELPHVARRASALLVLSIMLAFASRSFFGFVVLVLPLLLLCFAPVFSMHRVVLIRVLIISTLACACWIAIHALRDPAGFNFWVNSGLGLMLKGRNRFGPTFYLGTLLWFAWPAWPIAIWLLILRARGFNGGWQRAEVIAPVVFFVSALFAVVVLLDTRTIYTLSLLPPLILLAAFGVDTLKRTWYALIDWFGILMLGLATLVTMLTASALYLGWPAAMATWLARFVPGFSGHLPWYAYLLTALSFAVWLALIQPAHQHARRALINWAGCVTLFWVVSQTLLLAPGNYITAYREPFHQLALVWPKTDCVNSINLSQPYAALLRYHENKQTLPVATAAKASCPYILLDRYRGSPALPASAYTLVTRSSRPRDRHEAFELYKKTQP